MSRPANETIRRQAQEFFLGKIPVLGVGLTSEAGVLKLLFLLSHESEQAHEITRWAEGQGVEARIMVVGVPVLTGTVAS